MKNQFLKNEQIQSWIWFRCIDDIFFIWTASEKELDDYLERVNNFYPNLKFTHEHERTREQINFLDVVVRVNHGEFITNFYCKPADGHQYLHFESCHPSHTKSSIIFSQAVRRICSEKSDLVANFGKRKDWFKERDYQEDMVNKETKRALESPSLDHSKTSERRVSGNCGTGVPLVVNYNPILCRLGQVLRKNFCFLCQDEKVKQVFSPAPFVSFRSVRTLKSHLLRAKDYPVGERLVGSRKYNKHRCQVCKNLIENETFQCSLIRRFTKSIIDLHIVTNVWSTSCHVRYVVCNITMKLKMNSDTGRIILRITIRKA